MNELLHWMSAKRAGSRQSFRTKVMEFDSGTTLNAAAKSRIAEWNLSKLGHAEFEPDADGSGWRIAPPVLAARDFHPPYRAVFCGARTPKLVARLANAASPSALQCNSQTDGPDIIEIAAPNAPALAAIAASAGIPLQWNASFAILAACKRPKELGFQQTSLPVGGWKVVRFSKSKLAWVESSALEASQAVKGLFRFRSDFGTSYVLIENGTPLSCNPAEAKFRILPRRSRVLTYHAGTSELAIQISCRPPSLVERALVVCSGQAPSFRDGCFVYSRVERSVAAATAELLGQRLN